MSETKRAACPDCGKTITVKLDGTLRSHLGTTPEWTGSPFNRHCPASGTTPTKEGA